jgi:hypothetical protein
MTTVRRPRRKKTSPLFFELAGIEEDIWWKSLLLEIADGFFPHNVSYSTSTLFFRNRLGKYNNLILDPNFSKTEILTQLKEFFKNVVGIIPDQDLTDLYSKNEIIEVTYALIKKKDLIRDILVWKFLKTLELTKEEFKNLKREIFWGFIMDRWTPKTFVIENNEIIEFCPDEVKAVKNTRVQKKNKDSSSRVLKTVKMKMRTFDE